MMEIFKAKVGDNPLPLPLYLVNVQAGFPSPAEDYLDKTLDLNTLMIAHPAATFFVRVTGDSMRNAGIFSGDILVVDRSLEASDNKIVIAVVGGEFTVKRLKIHEWKDLACSRKSCVSCMGNERRERFPSLGRGHLCHPQSSLRRGYFF